jgi:flavin-binding protein dodecin
LRLREAILSIVKVIELSAQSAQGYEDAVRQVVERAARTIRNIRSVWVKEFEAVVESDQVTQFRVVVKISFLLDEGADAGSDNLGEAQGMGLPRGEG